MREQPDLTIPDVPLTVVARVYAKGDPLGGNICPPVSLPSHIAYPASRDPIILLAPPQLKTLRPTSICPSSSIMQRVPE